MDALNLRAEAREPEGAGVIIATAYLEPHVAKQNLRRRRWLMLFPVIVLTSAIVLHGIGKGEFDYNVDEAQHAVTGLFMADALRDLPITHPVQYTYNYYAQYPALAIVHWPPLFYLVESLSFLVLGPSVVSARLTILLFTILLLYSWFRLVEELQDSFTAAISTALLALIPIVLLFEKTVMLEIPSLAVGVTAIRMWIRYLNDGERRSLYWFGLWLSAALLLKQTSVYILMLCLFSLAATRKWYRIFNRDTLAVIGLCLVLVGPFYALMLVSQGRAVAYDLGSHQMSGLQRVAFYWLILPRTITTPILGLSVVGLAISRRWNSKEQILVMLCWLAAGYLTFTFFGQNEARFAIYWFPPLVYFAAGLLTQAFHAPRVRLAMRALAVVFVGFMGIHAWGYERPYISGYQEVASQLIRDYHSGIVLFDGEVPGNFVFYMRALDSRRQFLVLRKALYVNDVRKSQSSEELVHSREELMDLFKRYGIRFAVVSENSPLDFSDQLTLRQYLQSGQFQLLGRFSIQSNQKKWQGRNLVLYENKLWAPPAEEFLRIRMLTLNHDIVVPLNSFDFDQQGSANRPGEK